MYQGKSFLAIIPARSGSQGLKDKNIKPLCGKPL
ncbi:MAG: CMP-N-acetlyneuraminic acid synthetase, partial [Oscillospiraceae bacterium]